jgi:hypothetical protein
VEKGTKKKKQKERNTVNASIDGRYLRSFASPARDLPPIAIFLVTKTDYFWPAELLRG